MKQKIISLITLVIFISSSNISKTNSTNNQKIINIKKERKNAKIL
ncbi:MAG: hypothetical protein UR12_C0013G0014 [candidate division TM6 bacterium GW2011_GWF2_30_66]|jgi:hypothetical protein|nr:MAG: hypothetical protein UR12_C0013G0014 [candidate division TM6 bacterium GW2011_GWF2_30_66]